MCSRLISKKVADLRISLSTPHPQVTSYSTPLWIRNAHSTGEARDVGLIPGLGRFPGVRNGNPLQYSWLKNSMDRGASWAVWGWVSLWACKVRHDWVIVRTHTHTHTHKIMTTTKVCCHEQWSKYIYSKGKYRSTNSLCAQQKYFLKFKAK